MFLSCVSSYLNYVLNYSLQIYSMWFTAFIKSITWKGDSATSFGLNASSSSLGRKPQVTPTVSTWAACPVSISVLVSPRYKQSSFLSPSSSIRATTPSGACFSLSVYLVKCMISKYMGYILKGSLMRFIGQYGCQYAMFF